MFDKHPFPPRDPPAGRTNPSNAARPWTQALLPPFPPVALAILSLTTAQDVSGRELAALIRRDAAFTAELLRVANSALFGFSRRVASVGHAVVLLGLDRVKAMAMFVALRSPLRTALKRNPLKAVWRHTLATAMISETLAKQNALHSEEAYTAGLLHNIGAMGFMCAYPTDYAFLIETPLGGAEKLLEAERSMFGVDHCEAGASLANEWKFPELIAAVAKTHHDLPVCGDPTLPNLVRIAVRLAESIGFGTNPEPDSGPSREELLACAGIPSLESGEDLRQMIESQLAFVPQGE